MIVGSSPTAPMNEDWKLSQSCPECGKYTVPSDLPAVKYDEAIDFYVRLRRYVCKKCGWIWATAKMREHNAGEYAKRKQLARRIR